ncbi:hypothetical protein XELAEV_18030678mg [Xenopus laevis]|uniref:Limb region 1 protein homolog n=1 Tax=Xenopus laevis TaxID=8355 RepID=A0A974HF13_XENLA|nr:hypothetical protein XELAEV_18030678mg [Xenopus laevis]
MDTKGAQRSDPNEWERAVGSRDGQMRPRSNGIFSPIRSRSARLSARSRSGKPLGGIKARILETIVVLILLALLIFGIVWVASALIDNSSASKESLYDLWDCYLPYLYSCISLMGCLLLLLCTPVGLSRMFTVMGQLLVKPTILEDIDEQIYMIHLQEEALQRKLNGRNYTPDYSTKKIEHDLLNARSMKSKLERRKNASAWQRNLVYPAVMILLLIATFSSVILVSLNILRLLVDETAMPKASKGSGFGDASLFTFGFAGATLEIILILYLFN